MIWLDNSRILAIFAVVFLHVSAGVVVGNDVGTEHWWFGNIYDSVVRWCVPVFVMISGALLLDPNKKEDLSIFYTKRFSRILIPILFWSVFFLYWSFLKSVVQGNELTSIDLLKKLLSGKPYFHMWFLYMILGLYLFTPLFRKIIVLSSKKDLLFFIVVAFIISMLNSAYGAFSSGGSTLFINWFLLYVPYFFLGYFVRQDNYKPSKFFLWFVFLASFTLTCMGYYITAINTELGRGLYFYNYLSITVVPMSVSLMYILKTWNKPILNMAFTKKLSVLTLGIYLIHPVILEIINYMQYGAMSFHPMTSIPVTTFIVFIVSAGIVQVIYKTPYFRRTI